MPIRKAAAGGAIGSRRAPLRLPSYSGAVVTARLYRHGLQENGATRNLTRDHLLSIREVTDSGASLHARYEYAPFGTVTKVAGSNPDFLGFTGVLLHEPSDLFLMKRRAYDAMYSGEHR